MSEPRAATGHMPFPGHRTVAVVWAKQEACRRQAITNATRIAREYGFDPDSFKLPSALG